MITRYLSKSLLQRSSIPFNSLTTLSSRKFYSSNSQCILGIETTCDDTAMAIVTTDKKILAQSAVSQWKLLEQFQGVNPKYAAREHEKHMEQLYQTVLKQSGIEASQLSGVAVASGPGLAPCLDVGLTWSSQLAQSLSLPLFGVHHLEAHINVARFEYEEIQYPHLALVISGGHTELWLVKGLGQILILGRCLDDAIGEAFDKAFRLIGLTRNDEEPQGAALERWATQGDHTAFHLPPGMQHRPSTVQSCDFSYSGVKTALARQMKLLHASSDSSIPPSTLSNLSASFQHAVTAQLLSRLRNASQWAKQNYPEVKQLVMAGGVACNQFIRNKINEECQKQGLKLFVPRPSYCSDNGVMIGWLGISQLLQQRRTGQTMSKPYDIQHQPQWTAGEVIKIGPTDERPQQRAAKEKKRKEQLDIPVSLEFRLT